MSGDVHVRFCERVGVRFPRATRLVALVDYHPRHDWLVERISRRVREELEKLQVEVNEDKSRVADLRKGESFGFLGFEFRLQRTRKGNWRPYLTPKGKKRKELLRSLRKVFRSHVSQPAKCIIVDINPKLRGWVNYFSIGDSTRCFSYIRYWVERKMRRHLARNTKRKGFGWKRWSTPWLHRQLSLFDGYRLRYYPARLKVLPIR